MQRQWSVSSQPDTPTSATEQAIRNWLIWKFSERIGVQPDEIDIHQPFAHYGVKSIDLAMISVDLEQWLTRQLPPSLLREFSTIHNLARQLA